MLRLYALMLAVIIYPMKHKGILSHTNPADGKFHVTEIDLPIDTHMDTFAWGLDMLRKINEFGRFRKWLLRVILGRYAYRELIGLRDSIEKEGYHTKWEYGIERCDYHKDKIMPL